MSEQVEKKEEALNKSIDALIDAFFAEETQVASEEVKKSEPKAEEKKEAGSTESIAKASDAIHQIIGEQKQAKQEKDPNTTPATLADSSDNKAPKGEEDEEAGKKRGRPNDLSQMSMRDMSTGESKGSYDASIAHASENPSMKEAKQVKQPKNLEDNGSDKSANDSGSEEQSGASQSSSDKPELKEFSQVRLPEHMRKAEDTVTISKEEYETLKKTQNENLIKAEVEKVTSDLKKENEELKKSFSETQSLIKSLLKKPQVRKSVSTVGALEKSAEQGIDEGREFTKSEKVAAAEELLKSKELSLEDVIELETTGTFLDPRKKASVERKLRG